MGLAEPQADIASLVVLYMQLVVLVAAAEQQQLLLAEDLQIELTLRVNKVDKGLPQRVLWEEILLGMLVLAAAGVVELLLPHTTMEVTAEPPSDHFPLELLWEEQLMGHPVSKEETYHPL
jgi:hypothetical protein